MPTYSPLSALPVQKTIFFRPNAVLRRELTARGGVERGEGVGVVAKRDLERYYEALRRALADVDLNYEEAYALCDVLNGVILDATTIPLMWAQVADAIRHNNLARKWGIDGESLILRLRSYSYIQLLAIVDAVERWWRLSADTNEQDAALVSVGLVKEQPIRS